MKEFEKDFGEYHKQRFGLYPDESWSWGVSSFYELDDSITWGVYVDFFDSVGIRIDIDPDPPGRYAGRDGFDWYVYTSNENSTTVDICETRPEARKAALEKAIEIYEKRKLQNK